MHSQQPPGVVQNWSTLQCSKQNTEQCGYDHAPVTRGRMRAQFPLPHGPTKKGLGIQGILRPSLGDHTTEVGVPRDYGYQQLGNHPANPITTKNARGTGTARARAVSYAPGSASVRQPLGRASQISRQGSGDLLCMGNNHRVHTI